jgi:uncharacterized membrane protein required for colicin V production
MSLGIILDVIILFALVGSVLLGLQRGFVRTLVSTAMMFLASVLAALLYDPVIGIFTGNVGSSARAGGPIVFFGLLVVFFAILEFAVQRNYPDLRIKALGQADNILGAIVGLVWGFLGISLLLLIFDFSASVLGGPATFVSELIRTSYLTPLFRQFFKLPLSVIRLLFPAGLPEVLIYFTQ